MSKSRDVVGVTTTSFREWNCRPIKISDGVGVMISSKGDGDIAGPLPRTLTFISNNTPQTGVQVNRCIQHHRLKHITIIFDNDFRKRRVRCPKWRYLCNINSGQRSRRRGPYRWWHRRCWRTRYRRDNREHDRKGRTANRAGTSGCYHWDRRWDEEGRGGSRGGRAGTGEVTK